MSAVQSDNGRHHRVAANDLQANGKANHRHSGACHGYPVPMGNAREAGQPSIVQLTPVM